MNGKNSTGLSKLHFNYTEERFGRKKYIFFPSWSVKFSDFGLEVYGRVVKTQFHLFRGTFLGKPFRKGNFLYKFYRTLSKKISGLSAKNFGGIVINAFYKSLGRLWGFPKKREKVHSEQAYSEKNNLWRERFSFRNINFSSSIAASVCPDNGCDTQEYRHHFLRSSVRLTSLMAFRGNWEG